MKVVFDFVERKPGALTIRDVGSAQGKMSVTNDAEAVVEFLLHHKYLKPGQRLFYYDSEARLDELCFNAQGFTGFAVGPEMAQG